MSDAFWAYFPSLIALGVMEFTEKLKRLAERIGKAKLARAAGLPSTAVSNYLFKGQMPRADNALALARAAGVPLDWLIDEKQDWPPPKPGAVSPQGFSDEDLMREVCRRAKLEALRVSHELERLEKVNWPAFVREVAAIHPSSPLPAKLGAISHLVEAFPSIPARVQRYEPSFASHYFPDEFIAGAEGSLSTNLSADALLSRSRQLHSSAGFSQAEGVLIVRRESLSEREKEEEIGEILRELEPPPKGERSGRKSMKPR